MNRPKQPDSHDLERDRDAEAEPCGSDLELSGYSPATRRAIQRRLAEEPKEGPEAEDFNRVLRRSAEERRGGSGTR